MDKKNKINIRTIADLAGVSTATVSRALRSPDKVQPSTREKILAVAEKYSYMPRTATPAPSDIIMCFVNHLIDDFYAEVIHRLTDYAQADGHYVMVSNTNDHPETERNLFEYCKKMNYAGIVLTGQTQLTQIAADIPVALMDAASGLNGNFYEVTSDNEMAVKMLLEHLFRLHHKKIAFISGRKSNCAAQVREHAFRAVMEEHGLAVPEEYIFDGDFNIKSGFDAFEYFYAMPEMPTAVVAANDYMAKGFIIRANSFGVNVPKDISVCGIDSIDNDIFFPKITSVHQDTDRIAREIYGFIKKGKSASERIVLPVTFSYGDTCYML